MKIVLASHNRGKMEEMRTILAGYGVELVLQSELGVNIEVEETGTTFRENALLKAHAVADATGMPAISDDSGLMVDALNGAPGVYSARYSGEGATDEKNNAKLLSELEDVPDDKRTARFRTVVTCAFPDGTYFQVDGCCEGKILRAPEGSDGFGYDPLFWYAPFEKTFASLTPEEKNAVSHRGKAMRKFAEELPGELAKRGIN